MKYLCIVLLAVAVLGGVGRAEAGGVGFGVIVGEPTGLSAKFWLGGNTAVDAAAAWSVYRYAALHVHGDFLWHSFDLLKVSPGQLPLYLGIGGRLKLASDNYKTRVGMRVPFGLEYLFDELPIGLFLEVVPILNLLPETGFDMNGAIGGRFYFR
jgi:hypothetical protein